MEVTQVVTKLEGDRLNKENVLRDFVRMSWRASRGLSDVAEGEAKAMVKRLVDVGKVTSDQGEQILKALSFRMMASRVTFEQKLESSVRLAAERVVDVTRNEVARLQAQVGELEKRVESLMKS